MPREQAAPPVPRERLDKLHDRLIRMSLEHEDVTKIQPMYSEMREPPFTETKYGDFKTICQLIKVACFNR
jgi:hypothetical protein